VDTRPARLAVDTRPARLAVDTRPARLAVDTRPARLAVDTRFEYTKFVPRFTPIIEDTYNVCAETIVA
jgi:hypothetical protein